MGHRQSQTVHCGKTLKCTIEIQLYWLQLVTTVRSGQAVIIGFIGNFVVCPKNLFDILHLFRIRCCHSIICRNTRWRSASVIVKNNLQFYYHKTVNYSFNQYAKIKINRLLESNILFRNMEKTFFQLIFRCSCYLSNKVLRHFFFEKRINNLISNDSLLRKLCIDEVYNEIIETN